MAESNKFSPEVSYGPFVMNTRAEIAQTVQHYRRTPSGSVFGRRHHSRPDRFLKA